MGAFSFWKIIIGHIVDSVLVRIDFGKAGFSLNEIKINVIILIRTDNDNNPFKQILAISVQFY